MTPEHKESMSELERTGVTLGCGITAGIGAAIISQPGDTLLSKVSTLSPSPYRELFLMRPQGLETSSHKACS